jgi:hypothetical protein
MRIYRCDKCRRKVAFLIWMPQPKMEVCVDCYDERPRRNKKGRRNANEKKAEMC